MIKPVYLVAFSGHRPEATPGRTEAELNASAPRLKRTLQALREKTRSIGGEMHLVSSLAAGADVIACETAIALNIPIHLILAKPEAAFLETYHHSDPAKNLDHWLPRARAILATIRPDPELREIPIHPRHTMRYGATSTTSPDCYAETNTRLLESADLLLTLSTLDPSKSIAGTTHLITQANAIGIPTLNLHPADSPDAPVPSIPEAFAHSGCASLAPFAEIQPHITCDLGASQSPFADLAKCLGKAAKNSAGWFRRASAMAISFHLLATILAALVAAIYHALKSGKLAGVPEESPAIFWMLAVFACVELFLVGAGWWLERRLHHDKAQPTWLTCRFARELMRSMEKSSPFLDPLFPEIQRHQPHWKRFAITTGLMIRTEKSIPAYPTTDEIRSWRDDYLKHRVNDQEAFFAREARTAMIPTRRFHFLTHGAGLAAVVIVAVAFFVKAADVVHIVVLEKEAFTKSYYLTSAIGLLFLPILMPLLASIGASFGAVFDYGRRSTRYQDIAQGLAKTARILPILETRHDITTAVRQTEETLQDELIEWFAAQQKGLGH